MSRIILLLCAAMLLSACQSGKPEFAKGPAAKTQQIQIGPLVREILDAQNAGEYERALSLAEEGLKRPGLRNSEVISLMEFKANNAVLLERRDLAVQTWTEYLDLPDLRPDQRAEPLRGLFWYAHDAGDYRKAADYGEQYMAVMADPTNPPVPAGDYLKLIRTYDILGERYKAEYWRAQKAQSAE